MTAPRALFLLLPMFFLAACATSGGGYYEDDGPHSRIPPNLAAIPDAVPRTEPLSKGGNRPYSVYGVSYQPLKTSRGYRERGVASWYGKKFHGRKTSNGEAYDMYAMTAAHKTLPLPSYVRVRNLNNGKSVVVRVNDRGPFLHNRLIDLSYAAAERLGIVASGTGIVEVEGLTGDSPPTVTATPPALPQVIPAAVAAEPPRLYLQAGAFTSRVNADALRDRLVDKGFTPVHVEPVDRDGTPLYRVRLGPVPNVEESDRLVARITAQGLPAPIVVVEQ
ncbi:MAG: septal ring lytic transglycosylase RlpA family protein [Gammaproteobacteria bacterium]|nr:septal ring lytic transglycosylase RlpA family protein [Gammaproteobacteria bacterium]